MRSKHYAVTVFETNSHHLTVYKLYFTERSINEFNAIEFAMMKRTFNKTEIR